MVCHVQHLLMVYEQASSESKETMRIISPYDLLLHLFQFTFLFSITSHVAIYLYSTSKTVIPILTQNNTSYFLSAVKYLFIHSCLGLIQFTDVGVTYCTKSI